jgi:predicted dehydrogenase
LHCGAFSSDSEISKESGKAYFFLKKNVTVPIKKCFTKAFAKRERMDFVTIVTPNFAHFAPAMAALEHGFNVIIDKPITLTLEEAKNWKKKLGGLTNLCLTHTYSAYPMVKQARAMIAAINWVRLEK